MNCPSCTQAIDDDSQFCKHCGAAIESAPDSPLADAVAAKTPAPRPAPPEKAGDVYRDPKFEKQVWQGRPAWRSYWGTWVCWLLVSLICIIASHRWAGGDSALFKAVLLLSAGAAVVIFVREALRVLGVRYRLTTQRLFVHRGILTRTTDQMELMRVDDVRLRQGIVDRIVNTGNVEVIGSDATDQDIVLESVSTPAEVAEALRLHVRGARAKGTLLVENI
jgi:membrane protein YdbS with pleckstrin-like domain